VDVKLKVRTGPHAGREIPIQGSKFLIGRSEDCHLRPTSDMISRHHCVIIVDESYLEVRDFGSKNGTCVNGERVAAVRELHAGDVIAIGPIEFEVVILQRVGGPRKAPVKDVADVVDRTAKTTSGAYEEDIDDWLETSPEETRPSELRETRSISAAETGIISNPLHTTEESEQPQSEQAEEKKEGRRRAKAKPGKLPPLPKYKHKDSSDAAANVLRDMIRRR